MSIGFKIKSNMISEPFVHLGFKVVFGPIFYYFFCFSSPYKEKPDQTLFHISSKINKDVNFNEKKIK